MVTSWALIAVSLLHTVGAIASPGTVEFKFEKRYGHTNEHAVERRQAGTLYSLLSNELVFYQINVTVGTPAQHIGLQVDTGSSDIWLPDASGSLCRTSRGGCPLGSYDSQRSSTFTRLNYPPFQIAYVDGTKISGTYFTDVMTINGVNVKNVTMAAAGTGGRGFGIMGIAFRAGESSNSPLRPPSFTYPNILDSLKSQGLINDLSYALWLDDLQSNTGSILFGGIDTSKYYEPLISLPIQRDADTRGYTSMTVAWTGLTIYNSGPAYAIDYSPSTPQAAILDSGTTLTYVPDDIAQRLFNAFGITTDPTSGNLAPCRLGANNVTLAFQFGGPGGPVINVPLSEFLIGPLTNRRGNPATFTNGDTVCKFGIDSAGRSPILFGDTFLRSAYVVYDLQNLQIAIAQTNFLGPNSLNSASLQVIQSTGIPAVRSTANAVSLVQTATDSLFTGRATDTVIGSYDQASSTGAGGVYRSATLRLTATGTVAFTAQAQAGSSTSKTGTTRTASISASASTSASTTPTSNAGRVYTSHGGLIFAGAAVFGAGIIML